MNALIINYLTYIQFKLRNYINGHEDNNIKKDESIGGSISDENNVHGIRLEKNELIEQFFKLYVNENVMKNTLKEWMQCDGYSDIENILENIPVKSLIDVIKFCNMDSDETLKLYVNNSMQN